MTAPPLSLELLVTALLQGSSPVPAHRDHSTLLLTAWATAPTFYSLLVQTITDPAVAVHLADHAPLVRLQAALQFKNGLDRYWRRGAPNGIPLDERRAIRPLLLGLVNEPDRVLAKTIAVCVAKIARLDYGFDWDELPTSLLASLQYGLANTASPDGRLVLHRSLLFLHETVKALASNRLMKGRLLMAAVGAILFPTLRNLHTTLLTAAVQHLRERQPPAPSPPLDIDDLDLALLAFKTLSKLFLYGFKDVTADPQASDFFHSLLPTFSTLFTLRLSLLPAPETPPLVFLTRHVNAFGKLYRGLLAHDAAAFARFGTTDAIVDLYWQALQSAAANVAEFVADSSTARYPERFVVQSLLLISSTLGDWSSAPQTNPRPGFVAQLVPVLVTSFLPLRAGDLEKWDDDPEEWMNEEEADRWEFELRPCAEHVLQNLLGHYSDDLGPIMRSLLNQASNSQPTSMEGLLLKEGAYCAFGRCPSDLQGSIDFNAWLEHSLIPEAGSEDPNFLILRRRIAWLVGNWLAEDLKPHTHSRVCELLVHLLSRNASTNTAIRLTAARSLGKLCTGWTFDEESFLPFLPRVMAELVGLLGEVQLPDSQMRLNDTLGAVIDRVPSHIGAFAPQLVEVLAALWSASEESHFRTSILVTLTKLAEALGEQSQGLHARAWPIIQFSNDSARDAHIYLQEDALQLWQVLIRRSATISPEMMGLLPTLVVLLQSGTDVLPRVLAILESYLLLNACQVIQLFGTDLFTAFETLLGDLKLDAVKVILHAIETLFQTAPIEIWATALDASGTFLKLLYPIRSKESPLIVTKYLGTIARIVMAGPDTFHQLMQATAARLEISPESLWETLLTEWLDKIDNMSQSEQRKLTALALAYLLPSTNPVILSRMAELLSLWSGVLAERVETEGGDMDNFPEDYYEPSYDYAETLETARRKELMLRDPVFKVTTASVLRQKLGEAEAKNGGSQQFQATYLSSTQVDPEILEECIKRLDGRLVG